MCNLINTHKKPYAGNVRDMLEGGGNTSPTGLASVGNDAVKLATHCVSKATRLPIFCTLVFFAVTMMVVELDHIVRSERTSIPRKGDDHTT